MLNDEKAGKSNNQEHNQHGPGPMTSPGRVAYAFRRRFFRRRWRLFEILWFDIFHIAMLGKKTRNFFKLFAQVVSLLPKNRWVRNDQEGSRSSRQKQEIKGLLLQTAPAPFLTCSISIPTQRMCGWNRPVFPVWSTHTQTQGIPPLLVPKPCVQWRRTSCLATALPD